MLSVDINGFQLIHCRVRRFFLFDGNERLEKKIDYLKINKLLYPCHCVSIKAKNETAKKLFFRFNDV